jgi:hypothetical protein
MKNKAKKGMSLHKTIASGGSPKMVKASVKKIKNK